jgi:hypothetical protein
VWIETLKRVRNTSLMGSHPAWVCGLKQKPLTTYLIGKCSC